VNRLFPNAWHVAVREYTQRVQTRAFKITTVVLALVGVGLTLLPIGIRLISGDQQVHIGLYAEQGTVDASTLQTRLTDNAGAGGTQYQVVAISDPEGGRAQVRDGDLNGLLTVTRAANGDLRFQAYTDASSTSPQLQAVQLAANQLTVIDRLQRAGVDPGTAFAPTDFSVEPTNPSSNGRNAPFEGPAWAISYVLVILTFMAVVTYGSWVAASVAEEKSSRVMELLITAATPRQLMAGKVMGAGGAGLTQYVTILGAVLVGLLLQGVLAARIFGDANTNLLEGVNLWVLLPFTIFFVPGFLLYCTLYAGFGSIASRQEDVTQVTAPMLFIGMGGYFVSFIAMATPDQGWVKLLSLIPFFSPYLLAARFVLVNNVAPWEWAVAGLLMLLFIAGAIWLAARIYSAGVLLYGQRANLRGLWNAVRVNR
jgi:ABC-2 type transport system permease protein